MSELPPEVGVECTQFDRFFYRSSPKRGEIRCRLLSYDPRRGQYTIRLYGANAADLDGQVFRGVDRDDIRFHWDCPKDHPDW